MADATTEYFDRLLNLAAGAKDLSAALVAVFEDKTPEIINPHEECLSKSMICAALLLMDQKTKAHMARCVETIKKKQKELPTTVSYFDMLLRDIDPPAPKRKHRSRAKSQSMVGTSDTGPVDMVPDIHEQIIPPDKYVAVAEDLNQLEELDQPLQELPTYDPVAEAKAAKKK